MRSRTAPLLRASLLGAVLGCTSPPTPMAAPPTIEIAPLPSPLPDASSSGAPPAAQAAEASLPPDTGSASPFVEVAPIDAAMVGYAVYDLEDALLAQSGGAVVELSAGAARPRPDLGAGLPTDPCDALSGIVGRFPDAAFALVSRAGRPCGSVFGKHVIYRWTGSAWAAAPSSPGLKLMAYAGVGFSHGPGVVICDMNAVGDGCGGHYALLPRIAPGARSPVGRLVDSTLAGATFGFARSGTAFALGTRWDDSRAAVERWLPGRSKGEVTPLPLPGSCTPVGLHVVNDTSIFIAAACPADTEARLLRFDGRAFTAVPTPAKAPVRALTGEAGGALWIATADQREAAVFRRSPEGAWSRVPLPSEKGGGRPFEPAHLVVRGGDVWAIAASAFHAPRRAFDAPVTTP